MTFHLNGHCYQLSGHCIWWASYFPAWYGANRRRALLSQHMHSRWLRLGIILVLLGYRMPWISLGKLCRTQEKVSEREKPLNRIESISIPRPLEIKFHWSGKSWVCFHVFFMFIVIDMYVCSFNAIPCQRCVVDGCTTNNVDGCTRYCQTVLSLESKTVEKIDPVEVPVANCTRVYICRQNRLLI